MELVQLCQVCTEINFEALRNPLISDIPALKEGRVDTSRHPFIDKRDDANRSSPLGTFSELLQRSNPCRYVALSYVWGGPQRERLELSNIDTLAHPGSLSRKLPQTIEDTILLTESMGIEYLWVDALCIIQDDDVNKKIQIRSMGQIYGFAYLAIIAASGSNVHSSLPNLLPKTRSRIQEEVAVLPSSGTSTADNAVPGLSLMMTLDPLSNPNEHYLERTPWNSHGWTMQERVLSRRVLVYMPEQVYWVCREATFCEESYQNLVATFTRRGFTCNGDVFDGFIGVK